MRGLPVLQESGGLDMVRVSRPDLRRIAVVICDVDIGACLKSLSNVGRSPFDAATISAVPPRTSCPLTSAPDSNNSCAASR